MKHEQTATFRRLWHMQQLCSWNGLSTSWTV